MADFELVKRLVPEVDYVARPWNTEWSNAQRVRAPITIIPPTTTDTYHGFGHVMYSS